MTIPTIFSTSKDTAVVATNKAMLFSHKVGVSDDFKKDVNTQLTSLFANPEQINKTTVNEFASICSSHLLSSKEYQPQLNKRVMDIVGKTDDQIVEGLLGLKTAADRITPDKISLLKPRSIINRTLKIFGKDWNKGSLAKAMTRFESANDIIENICSTLAEAKDVVATDLQTLLAVGDDLASSQLGIEKDIYLLEELVNKLDNGSAPLPNFTEEGTKNLIVSLKQDLLDLKTLQNVNDQFLITIEQTCKGARFRIKSVDRACGLTMKTAMIGLLLRGVMENNARIQEACDASREFTSAQLVSNAEMFKDQTQKLQKSTSQTFVELASMKKAYGIITATLEESSNGLNQANQDLQLALDQMNQIKLPPIPSMEKKMLGQ